MNKFKMGAHIGAMVEKRPAVNARPIVRSVWDIECYDKDGNLKWSEIGLENIVTEEGRDSLLGIMFNAATQITTWYIAIFESDTSPAAGHTYAVPVFTESTAYDEATRPAYNEAPPDSQSITNTANKATFTMNATKTIYGAALVGGGTGADTIDDQAGGGTLFCSVKFGTSKSVVDDDVLKVTVTLNASDVP